VTFAILSLGQIRLIVRVEYFGVVREIAGKREETLEVPTAIALLGLLKILAVKYGNDLASYLFEPKSLIPRPIHLYLVNGEAYTAGETTTVTLGEGSVVSIIPTQGG